LGGEFWEGVVQHFWFLRSLIGTGVDSFPPGVGVGIAKVAEVAEVGCRFWLALLGS
jgi:hypothetical protein